MFSSRYHKSLGESFAYKEKNMGRNELIGEMSPFECQQYFNHITNEVSLADPLWRYITTMTTKPSFRIFGDATWILFLHSAVLRTNPPNNYILLCCLNPCFFRSSLVLVPLSTTILPTSLTEELFVVCYPIYWCISTLPSEKSHSSSTHHLNIS